MVFKQTLIDTTGSWSANRVIEIMRVAGFKMRRTRAYDLLKEQQQERSTRGFRRDGNNSAIVPPIVPGTVPGTIPKEKERSKEKEIRVTPTLTSFGSVPNFGDLETDVLGYLLNAAAENNDGKIAVSRGVFLRRELFSALEKHGDRASFADGLRVANSAGAPNKTYVLKAAVTAQKKMAGTSNGVCAPRLALVPDDPTAERMRRLQAEADAKC